MSVKEERHCRLCLKVAKGESEIDEIDENMKQIFEILSLKLDLDITRDPIICQDCMIVSKKCLDFKDTCIDTEEFILLYSADRKKVKFDIKDIYEERKHTRTLFDEDFDICRLCLTRIERNHFTPLDVLTNESMFEMLSQYMAETDFNSIENPLVCANCKEKMNDYFKFVLSCQDIEGKIKAYCKRRGSDDMEYTDNSSPTYKVEQEPTEVLYPEAHINLIKHEEVDIKDEEMAEIDLQKNADRFSPKGYDKETKSEMIYLNSGEHSTERLTYKKNIQENIMEDCLFDGDVLVPKSNEIRETGINKTDGIFIDETKQKERVKGDFANNSYALEADTYENKLYTFEATQRGVLKKRATTCKVAPRPKQKHKVKMLIPEISSDIQSNISVDGNIVPLYKCSLCTYGSYRKSNLIAHMLIHKDVSKIKMYKCSLCTYETKKKGNLKTHMLVHKDVSKIKMYKCSFCAYEAKNKSSLNVHMVVHKDISEMNVYKCSLCTHQSKRKGDLKIHMLVHKDVSEIKVYKCALCAYEGKRKGSLKSHMLVHKDVSVIKMNKCSFCTYEAKRKNSLTAHMLVHKDVSEINTYKCSLCDFETKRKYSLKTHMLVHKNVSERNMYKCELCPYETKQKSSHKKHILVHKGDFIDSIKNNFKSRVKW